MLYTIPRVRRARNPGEIETATLAILVATQLILVVPDGDPAKMITATATLTVMVGVFLMLAAALRLGFVANFISAPVLTGFKAGIGLLIVLDMSRVTDLEYSALQMARSNRTLPGDAGNGRRRAATCVLLIRTFPART